MSWWGWWISKKIENTVEQEEREEINSEEQENKESE
jgi:hypothetical protein